MSGAKTGEQTEPIQLLTLERSELGYRWATAAQAWAKAEQSGKTNLFSKVGIGANAVTFTLHRQRLSLANAVLWRGRYCFLTSISEEGRLQMRLEAALVTTVTCTADAGRTPVGTQFPGVLTEKYLRHEQGEPMALNVLCYVLVTPKAVELTPGGLVDIAGELFQVLVGHTLDPFKNEYEILRKKDL